jgi:uncharacterized protein YggE
MSIRPLRASIALSAAVLAGSLLLASGSGSARATSPSAADSPVRSVTVVGRGEVQAKPDIATTNLGVEVLAPTVEQALAEANQRMDILLAALKGAGVDEKDIQTSNFSINFERSPVEPKPVPEGTQPEQPAGSYRVSNMVRVIVRDLNQVGKVIDMAVKAGANNVWGISFGLDETDALESAARASAVADARARAESLARLNTVELGEVLTISEVIGGGSGPVMMDAAFGKGGGGAPVEAGEVTYLSQVQITYAIR